MRFLVIALTSAGGAGYSPVASGTAGALVGVALYAAIASFGALGVLACALVLLAVGIVASDAAERIYGHEDDGRIVIDEVVGQLLSLVPVPLVAPASPRSPLLLAVAFFAFRLFDIWKPGPVRWAERNFSGGKGVMLDDACAGLMAGAGVALLGLALGRAS
jgi:phosphatidylglycerophosphatase A